jgi:hypothetical protein
MESFHPCININNKNPKEISRRKHSSQDARTTNEKDDEKEKPPENSTKERFPITLQALNSYEERPKKTQQPSKLTQQTPNSTIKKQG